MNSPPKPDSDLSNPETSQTSPLKAPSNSAADQPSSSSLSGISDINTQSSPNQNENLYKVDPSSTSINQFEHLSQNFNQGSIRSVRSVQDDAFTRHSRARSYGSSLLDCLNDRAYNYNSLYPFPPQTINSSSQQPDPSASNQDSSVNRISDDLSTNGLNEHIANNSHDFNNSTTKISNESIFGMPPGLETPPPGLSDAFSTQKSFTNSLGLPNDISNSSSGLLRGPLSNSYYKAPFARRHGASASMSVSRAKAALYGSKLSSDLFSDSNLNSQNAWPSDYQTPIKSSLSTQDTSRVFYSRDGDLIPPVPPLPDLSTLNIQSPSNNETTQGSLISRGVSVPDTWEANKPVENSLHGYTFGSTLNGTNSVNNNNLNPSVNPSPSENQKLPDEPRTHYRSRTLGNSLETISSGLLNTNYQSNNDLISYINRMGQIDPNNFPVPQSDYNPNDYILYSDYDEKIDNNFIAQPNGRHMRQASMGFLGLGRRIGMDKIAPSYSMTNLNGIPRNEDDFHLSNFTSIGRAGTSSLLHGIRSGGSHHVSSLSVSGSIGVPYESSPTRSLWVGNLDLSITPRELIEVFGKFGRVESLRTLPDKECAFINFMRLEDAMRAHDEMQGGVIKNSAIRVGYGKGEGYATSDAQAMQPTRALWVGNISPNTTPASLRKLFEAYGVVESARILGQKSCGFVNFEKIEDAVRAKQATNGKELDGMVVRIGYAKVPVRGPEGYSRPRNQVPVAPPLTVSGRIAEANAIVGTSTSGLGSENVLEPGVPVMDESLVAFQFATSIPPLPISNSQLIPGQTRLRELRKRLDSNCPQSEFNSIFEETISSLVDLCTDYVGNMLVQKLAERGSFDQKMKIIKTVAPYIASIGIHKNGTWAIQKIIDCANTKEHQEVIAEATRPYVPQLLLDQLGNYVAQCCLAFPENRNQFIFDSIHARSWDIAQGRFGARAIRTCLENSNTTRAQQKLVAVVLVLNAVSLSTNANGNILISWLLDSSNFPGRFRVIAPQLAGHLRHLCTHKLGSATILKIIDQREEPDARDLILNTLFFNPEHQVLDDILSDQVHGANVILNALTSSCVDNSEKARIARRIQSALVPLQLQGVQGYHGLYEAVDSTLALSYQNENLLDQDMTYSNFSPEGRAQNSSIYYNNQNNTNTSHSPVNTSQNNYSQNMSNNTNTTQSQINNSDVSPSIIEQTPVMNFQHGSNILLQNSGQAFINQKEGLLTNSQVSSVDQKVYY
ncbi:Pumilio domain-containing protein [Smittium culicis]|uniref:Pumilio domain-containing protein n=1 Tax=Smittium culicis TaxID=133412 RepID=A0A1R1YB01_9FUNG|nr:Pumilio domain-containing protein [Smittium culicis]